MLLEAIKLALQAIRRNVMRSFLTVLGIVIGVGAVIAMVTIGNAPEKSVVHLDWLPDSGTRLTFNGTAKGSDIAGEDFYRALLRIWLGDKPAQDDLKEHLLGKAS